MPQPSIILDTDALRDKNFINWLKGYTGDIFVPPVVYMEICRQQKVKGNSLDELDGWFNALNIKVLWFDRNYARIAAELMSERTNVLCQSCNKIFRTKNQKSMP
jgi:predicted nucleic acid-binding protein